MASGIYRGSTSELSRSIRHLSSAHRDTRFHQSPLHTCRTLASAIQMSHAALCSPAAAAPGALALCSADHVRRPASQAAAPAVGSGSLSASSRRSGWIPSLCQTPCQTAGQLGSENHLRGLCKSVFSNPGATSQCVAVDIYLNYSYLK